MTPTTAPTPPTTAVALAVGIHHDRNRHRLLLRLPDGRRAVSLPLTRDDLGRIPAPSPTARSFRSTVRWLTPPVAVRVKDAPDGHGILFAGLSLPARARPADV